MALHFVRFPDNHGRQFQNAVRVFGPPDFLLEIAARTFSLTLMERGFA